MSKRPARRTKSATEVVRCPWATTEQYIEYHDKEWGVPLYDDRILFEFLILEGAQAGLSWLTILRKRENFREAFDHFDPAIVAKYGERKQQTLLDRLRQRSTAGPGRVLPTPPLYGRLSDRALSHHDHCINPDPGTEKYYLDYGPLLDAMRGKRWVLQPHCVEVVDGKAKANLFAVPGGYVAPVVYGGVNASVVIKLRNIPGLSVKACCRVLLPGTGRPQPAVADISRQELVATVPLKRGCAMVQVTGVEEQP